MDLILDLIVTVVSLSVIVQYSWSLKAHFNSPKMPTGTVVISVVVLTTAAIYTALLWIESQPALATLVGLVLEGLALWLFWAAIRASRAARLKMAFDVQNPHGLVTTGPYRYLRHPFYTSYLIFWVGWAIATWSLWSVLPLAVIVVIYVTAALGEERKFSRTAMAADYDAYRQRTGFFWPKPKA
jgi:protein-S-isoprenylcysteine O-methyltransferase Ste14